MSILNCLLLFAANFIVISGVGGINSCCKHFKADDVFACFKNELNNLQYHNNLNENNNIPITIVSYYTDDIIQYAGTMCIQHTYVIIVE